MKTLKYIAFYDQCGRTWQDTIQVTARDANSGLSKAMKLALMGLPKFTTLTRIEQHLTNTYLGDVKDSNPYTVNDTPRASRKVS